MTSLLAVRRLVIFMFLILRRRYWTYTLNKFLMCVETTTWKAEMASTCANIFARREYSISSFFIVLFPPACYFHPINYQTVCIPRIILLMNGFDVISSRSSSFIDVIHGKRYLHYLCICIKVARTDFRVCSEIFKAWSLREICDT